MPIANFPTAAVIGVPIYNYYEKLVPQWEEITLESTYTDRGADFNVSAVAPPQQWLIKLLGLNETQAKIVLDHYTLARGRVETFTFVEPRDFPKTGAGATLSGVQYDKFEHTRPVEKYWIHSFSILLVKRP